MAPAVEKPMSLKSEDWIPLPVPDWLDVEFQADPQAWRTWAAQDDLVWLEAHGASDQTIVTARQRRDRAYAQLRLRARARRSAASTACSKPGRPSRSRPACRARG